MPVKWNQKKHKTLEECSTHPEAPEGLMVQPGYCADNETSIMVVNESALAVTVRETDKLAIGLGEDDVPTTEDCRAQQKQISDFANSIDWESCATKKTFHLSCVLAIKTLHLPSGPIRVQSSY